MNTMKKIVAFAMIISMVLGCMIISTSAAEEKAAYVDQGKKDGALVAWYDATNNNNGTHDTKADIWKDLSGNANHISVAAAYSAGQIEWSDGALIIKDGGMYLQLPTRVKEALEGDAYTIEIVTGDLEYTATDYITLLSSANDELSVFIRCGGEYAPGQANALKLEYKNQDANGDSNRPYLYNAWEKFNGKTLTVTSDLDAFDGERSGDGDGDQDNVLMYSDGTKIGQGESEYNMELDYVYFGNTASNREWHGEIYALRIYNRALTAEEVLQNAQADQNNYRANKTFAPKQEYDPALDANAEGFVDLSDAKYQDNTKLVFDANTDMIPLTGFYGSVNLLDYLYPYESDEEQWIGAKLQKTEEADTDYDGNVKSGTSFDILYQPYCTRAGIKPIAGKDCQYVVLSMIVKGEVEDFDMNVIASGDVEFSTGSYEGGINLDKQGEVQHVIYDVEGIFDECEYIEKMSVSISGMTDDTAIYLQGISFFKSEKDACEFAGVAYDPDKETTKKPEDTTKAPVTEAPTDAPDNTTKAPETTKASGGCSAVVGFGAAAIMVAAAAAVVLKKKD